VAKTRVFENGAQGNAGAWICSEFPQNTENPKYAPQNVILNRCEIVDNTWGAMWRMVNDSYVINCEFANKKVDMGLLKCNVTMENSSFGTGNGIYTDVKQWPSDVKMLW
jgi:hypothetical protein